MSSQCAHVQVRTTFSLLNLPHFLPEKVDNRWTIPAEMGKKGNDNGNDDDNLCKR